MFITLDVEELNHLHRRLTHDWHRCPKRSQTTWPWVAIEENHDFNFQLWHEEDIARSDEISLERLREAKRNIDRFNQARNNAMEKIDDYILGKLHESGLLTTGGSLHSETPGMMIDRLSIMTLKEYHMQEQASRDDASAEHREKCMARVEVLQDQQRDLAHALSVILKELILGQRRFKVYRQFKMYNDPTLNPHLYERDCPV